MSVCFSLPLQGHCAEVWCLAVSSNGGLVVRILYMHTNTQALSGMSVPGVRITWPLDEGVGAHTRATRTVWAARNCELNCGIYIVRHVRAYFLVGAWEGSGSAGRRGWAGESGESGDAPSRLLVINHPFAGAWRERWGGCAAINKIKGHPQLSESAISDWCFHPTYYSKLLSNYPAITVYKQSIRLCHRKLPLSIIPSTHTHTYRQTVWWRHCL